MSDRPRARSLLGDPEVVALLRRRHAEGSLPHARRDPHRVAVVVGGGGMRGAYPAGMLDALDSIGLRDAVDEVYGASSGSFLAACFAAGHAGGAAASFPEDLASRAFVDLRRLAGRRPVLSLDHLLDHVLGVTKPMPWAALLASPLRVRIVATAVDDLRPRVLGGLTDPESWRRGLRASAAIPLFAGPAVEHQGRRWVDGSIGEPLALARAVRGGATHVLVLLSRPTAELRLDVGVRMPWWARALDRCIPGLGTLSQGEGRYGADLALVTDLEHPERRGALLAAIEPYTGTGTGALTVDPGPVGDAVRVGRESALAALASDAVPYR
ncbi:patatin-like phospholipase family protein [Pseudonocardia sp. KRD291]|uniref:patatin-like phospholipase family protein n=1 Tax=Pseudonocardia sp. KRD291 TaxID=2792007 RepID=UPI001C4A3A56|nr:patatin-like phospholipase family protein [Pseudonocardia sp. KRD291]MBW0102486.1 patatin-like phospholipase family protein [Pseudonocardia sp. KRD291]